jgi:membrane protein
VSAEIEVRGRAHAPAAAERTQVRAALRLVGRLVAGTTRICLRYRVTGLAAEAGFFALLSLPPLVLGLVGSIGYASRWIGADVVNDLRGRITELAGTFLTEDAVSSVILPTYDDVVAGGRVEIVSLGFLLSLSSTAAVTSRMLPIVVVSRALQPMRSARKRHSSLRRRSNPTQTQSILRSPWWISYGSMRMATS